MKTYYARPVIFLNEKVSKRKWSVTLGSVTMKRAHSTLLNIKLAWLTELFEIRKSDSEKFPLLKGGYKKLPFKKK